MVCQDGLNGYLDNTNHFIFWLCNMKQLNFRHFNTNSKKFCEAVIFFQKEEKKAPERLILSYLVCQGVFGHHYYDNLFPKISEKPSKHQAQLPAGVRENDPPPPQTLTLTLPLREGSKTGPGGRRKSSLSKHFTVLSSETVNISKLANLT